MAGPNTPLITSGSKASASIGAPDSAEVASETDHDRLRDRLRASGRAPRVVGSFDHAVLPMPPVRGRIVTSPTNGAAGVIPAVLKYIIEFISDDPEKSIETFLLTAAAVGMLFKRGSTISAAEGGCQAEVGVACSMASAGFAACMGASPETVLQASDDFNLFLVQKLNILPILSRLQKLASERNSLGGKVDTVGEYTWLNLLPAVKAVTAAQLSMASDGVYSVTLDEAIEAMRLTAADMSVKYKETSLSVRAFLIEQIHTGSYDLCLLGSCGKL
ncbi:hypothetical protein H0H81_001063 [Sphagnurus paluster]|uniref:Serine dehydratase-like alpha subunit domain-containing protein n=1 Tax=Sphagnurus paluster TaxID=117069 RepID=A0A9P7KK53_9AGAR|nr:hypothetical protein H0H81_001063 [Sphagnurus paluster]